MIRLEKLTRYYGRIPAVVDLNLQVDKGSFCVLIGPSGCGKSTTLRMINRLIPATSGSVFIGGKDISTIDPVLLRREIGYVIQDVGLFPHMTVAQNIGTVPRLLRWKPARIRDRVLELMDMLDLDPGFERRYPHSLSGGQAQRVGVARALAADPPVLLMDEPFGAVDPVTRDRLQTMFLRLQSELRKTVIMVTHDMDEAVRMADMIVIMREGRIEQAASVDTVLDEPATRFVREFVGRDRAIKKLSRHRVSEWLRTVRSVGPDDPAGYPETPDGADECRWVTDSGGMLLGWIDRMNGEPSARVGELYVRIDPLEEGIQADASLKEALSRMMGRSLRCLPVVNRRGRLLGELRFSDVERALLNADGRGA